MKPTRILLVDMPRMLREIIETTLKGEPDMTVVRTVDGGAGQIRTTLDETRPDVIVVGAGKSELLARCRDVLSTFPRVKVLAVSADARDATFYELRPATHRLGELSPVDLVDSIRSARSRRLNWDNE